MNWINTYLGDPGKLQEDMERFTKATAENVNRFTNRYLRLDRRAILHVIARSDMVAATTELDRSIQPAPMAVPSFTPPEIQRAKLSNGLELLLVQDYRTHTVQANLVIRGGWGNDPMDRPGAALLAAELLDGGTETRTAMQIAEDAKGLGADISTGSSYDESTVTLNVLERNLDAGLELVADMVLNPTFPDDELERQRKLYLGRIQEQSKQAITVATKLFLRFIHGPEHPYGQPHTGSGTEMSIRAIGRDDLVNYYKANYLPNNAAIGMVGDITLDEARAKLEKAFGNWKPGEHVQREIPESPPSKISKVYIVDKPGAVQSAIVVGNLGIRRTDPDYMACEVLNQAFGGQFGSRISVNLREDKGYTYGARSSFFSYRGTGAFDVWTQVQTEVTAEAVSAIIREMRDIVGSRPLAGDELTDIKSNMIKGFPQGFETYWSIANELSKIFIYDLPDDEWSSYTSRVESIDEAAVAEAVREHLHPDAILIVIVGDREKIEPAIRKLALGNIHFVNAEGDPVE